MMATRRPILSEISRIHLNQTPAIQQAAQQAHLMNQTRTRRSFQHVGRNIQNQINRHHES